MSVHTQNILTLDDTPSAPRTNRDEERAGLFVDALRLGGRIRLEVHGESMLPALWPADTVEIECCSMQDVQVGDIVLAQRDARMFLHRLISCMPDGFTLRGDSVPNPDPWFKPDALLGRLVSHHGPFVSTPALSRSLGLLLCHLAWFRRFALSLHVRRTSSAGELPSLEVRK